MGGGSTGTQPHVRVFNLIKALFFFVQNETERDQTEVRANMTSAANIKTITCSCFPESSFGVTSTKLYRANVGKADLTNRTLNF